MRVPELCRDRAAVVIVGDVGLQLSRTPFYQRELSLRFARSYGPGRYDPSYEAWGVDYPAGQVRWSEGRNFEAVLDLLAAGRLAVGDLVTHTFGIGDAVQAYRLIEDRPEPYLAIRLDYPGTADPERAVEVRQARATRRRPGAPARASASSARALSPPGRCCPPSGPPGLRRLVAVASARGLTAARTAQRHGFERAVAGAEAVLTDPGVSIVVIATPHDTHASLTVRALAAGRHVWCEKPVGADRGRA